MTSHQFYPFSALAEKNTDEEHGRVYAQTLIWSGNFLCGSGMDQFETTRSYIGINPEHFTWDLKPGESFQAPEAVLVYTEEGLGGMTHVFHDLFRDHLIRSPYLHKERPVLINNWEATYFDFDTEKLLNIARDAKESGIEMLVMDDGWFGKRNDDNSSLGDWIVNEEKLPGGLTRLSDELEKIGIGVAAYGNILSSPQVFETLIKTKAVIFVERENKSAYKNIEREKLMAGGCGVKILGAICIY